MNFEKTVLTIYPNGALNLDIHGKGVDSFDDLSKINLPGAQLSCLLIIVLTESGIATITRMRQYEPEENGA